MKIFYMFTSQIRAGVVYDCLNVNTGILCSLVHLLDSPHHGLHPLEPPVVGARHHLTTVWPSVQWKQTDKCHLGTGVTSAIVWFLYSEHLCFNLQLSVDSTCGI